jgi:hypothetical protein
MIQYTFHHFRHLKMRSRNLETTTFVTLKMRVINKENDRMFQKAKEHNLTFIPPYHHLNEFPRYLTMDYHHATVSQVSLM